MIFKVHYFVNNLEHIAIVAADDDHDAEFKIVNNYNNKPEIINVTEHSIINNPVIHTEVYENI